MTSPSWFALYVKPRHEKNVARILRGKGYDEFLPQYPHRTPSRTSELPLFPGYVFCRFDPAHKLPILTVPGVFSIVSFGPNAVAVDDSEIEALKQVVRSGLPRQPWPGVPSGTRVRVTSGPLSGVEGVVTDNRSGRRLVVSVELLQRSVAVELPGGHVEIDERRPASIPPPCFDPVPRAIFRV